MLGQVPVVTRRRSPDEGRAVRLAPKLADVGSVGTSPAMVEARQPRADSVQVGPSRWRSPGQEQQRALRPEATGVYRAVTTPDAHKGRRIEEDEA